MAVATRARMASAFCGSPAACSSITRSTMDRAKVTPQALIAWRSQGARKWMCAGSTGAAAISSSGPRGVPSAVRTWAAGSSISQMSRTRGAVREVMSITSPSRSVTTAGPAASGSQTRPSQVPLSSSIISALPCRFARGASAVLVRAAGIEPARDEPRRF